MISYIKYHWPTWNQVHFGNNSSLNKDLSWTHLGSTLQCFDVVGFYQMFMQGASACLSSFGRHAWLSPWGLLVQRPLLDSSRSPSSSSKEKSATKSKQSNESNSAARYHCVNDIKHTCVLHLVVGALLKKQNCNLGLDVFGMNIKCPSTKCHLENVISLASYLEGRLFLFLATPISCLMLQFSGVFQESNQKVSKYMFKGFLKCSFLT